MSDGNSFEGYLRAIAPQRCTAMRRMTIKDFIFMLTGRGIDCRCTRYVGHEEHGYAHLDVDNKSW